MIFTANVVASFFGSFEPCGPQPWPAQARKHPAVAGRAPQAAPESKSFVILNEVKNLFPCEPKAADGLCRARRRKTNEVQSNICIVSIQILRRSAPQNDKLLNCSQTPRQTGICNWRQRGEVKGKDRCSGRLRFVEIQSGFSRASRSPALRRLAKLAPRASARKQHSTDRSRACELKQRALFLNGANVACGSEPGDSRSGEPPRREAAACATLRITKPQNEKKRRSNNRPQTTIPYQSSRAITPPADC